jgi:hypothetical protein
VIEPKGRIICGSGDEEIACRLMAALRAEAGEDMFIEVIGRDSGVFDVSMCDGVFRFPTYCANTADGRFNPVSPEEFARTLMGSGA